MLKVKTIARDSPIHGRGLFADELIPVGALVWRYEQISDIKIPFTIASDQQLKHGYVNPRNRISLVICGDDSRFINFSDNANLHEVIQLGESDLVAGRNIEKGEEITIDPSTDADYERKMKEAN